MRVFARLSRLELKLFLREPLTVLFSFALPLTVLFVMGGVFGNEVDPEFYRGVGSMDYYVPAYVVLVAAAVALITLPAHIAGNRERGVLKRYRASSMPAWAVVASQVTATFVVAAASAAVLVAVAMPTHGVVAPESLLGVLGGFGLVGLAMAALGVLLGAVLPTARAAQALGVMLWFVMLMVGGAGPPPEVLTGPMDAVGLATPMRHAIRVMQDTWLGLDAGLSWGIVAAVLVASAGLALAYFRWE
jgi:ABC-2 type transport system permease protein